jgi:secondary thiamine-phosphate synthase enzyme
MMRTLSISTAGQGLYEITSEVAKVLAESNIEQGLCTIFIQHTSASLLIQENADPSARQDLERWLKRLVPERDPHFTHTAEGPDDMPAHIKAALTPTSIGIPVSGNELMLGTWQGIYLWEHRALPHRRKVVVSVLGEGDS